MFSAIVKNSRVVFPLDDKNTLLDCLRWELCFCKASLTTGQRRKQKTVIPGCTQRYNRVFWYRVLKERTDSGKSSENMLNFC